MKKWLFNRFAIDKLWYTRHPLRWVLFPLSCVYQAFVVLRRAYLQKFRQQHCSVPIIVVGNITVGGVGKTPLVIAIAQKLCAQGLRVGIVSRGYGATVKHFPHEVMLSDEANNVGDEPLLLAIKTGAPVVIAPNRVSAVRYLLDKYDSQVIISDDGLQHYWMGRAIEIAVVDGVRALGNGLCLPAGPLREAKSRLKQVDMVVVNGGDGVQFPDLQSFYHMQLRPGQLTRVLDGKRSDMTQLPKMVAAIAAIGNPSRFFETLTSLGVSFKAYPFPDHHSFRPEELQLSEKTMVMTEKDAVKCKAFANGEMYYLPVEAVVCDEFWDVLWSALQKHLH